MKILSDRGTEFMGRIWKGLLKILGIHEVFSLPYYPQNNTIVDWIYHIICNMIWATTAHKRDRKWVLALPGIMLDLDEMSYQTLGYLASQMIWGKGMKLLVDQHYSSQTPVIQVPMTYMRELGGELQKISEQIIPLNKHKGTNQSNPFIAGDSILILQQRMECDYKFSKRGTTLSK